MILKMAKDSFFKASIWYTIGYLFIKGMGVLTTPVFSRILTETEYGIFDNFNALLSIMLIVSSLCFSATLLRARLDFKNDIISYIKTCLLAETVFVAFIFLIYFFNSEFFNSLFQLNGYYFGLFFLSLIITPAFEMFTQLKQLNYEYKIVSGLNVSLALLCVIFSFILIYLMEDNLNARILGSQLPVLIVGSVIYIYILFSGKEIKLSYLKYGLPICIPFVFHSLSGAILNSSDRTMITVMIGADKTAFYSLACSVAQLTGVVWMSMNSAFIPWLCDELEKNNYKETYRFSKTYVVIYLMIVAGVMLLAPEILYVLGGEKYMPAKFTIPSLLVSNVFLFVYSMYVNVEQYIKKTKWMAAATTICSLINVALNYFLIPRFGYCAAGYTTMIGYLIMVFLHYTIIKQYNMQKVYNNKYLFLTVALSLALSVLAPVLYAFNFLRLIIFLIYILILLCISLKNKDLIFEYLHKKKLN